jgi:hypothetical protein
MKIALTRQPNGAQAGPEPLPIMALSRMSAGPTPSRIPTPSSGLPGCLGGKYRTPQRTTLEDALKVFSKFSENFLLQPQSGARFRLDTVTHVGYDRCEARHETAGTRGRPSPEGSHHGMASGVEQDASPVWGKEGGHDLCLW